ncbi:hypothetical protein BpHYR1_020359 [Brachionus plicatilis]|uniref:Uncharacterized protein n=1 Tax=Brachionus plicatilis TaxID=10195 RepID=A0A3M7QNL6_BRAPC|nr:hypothetical protein BpHYR1_020359 [Brachionus plicatilis]
MILTAIRIYAISIRSLRSPGFFCSKVPSS